jgi:hypothetical protein
MKAEKIYSYAKNSNSIFSLIRTRYPEPWSVLYDQIALWTEPREGFIRPFVHSLYYEISYICYEVLNFLIFWDKCVNARYKFTEILEERMPPY